MCCEARYERSLAILARKSDLEIQLIGFDLEVGELTFGEGRVVAPSLSDSAVVIVPVGARANGSWWESC